MTKHVDTKIIIAAIEQLARDVQSGDGVANAALWQAAERMRELEEQMPLRINKKELSLICDFLEQYSDDLGSKCCNDWNFPRDWTQDERREFVKEYHDYNGDPEEFSPDHLHLHDFCAVGLLRHKLQKSLMKQSSATKQKG